MPNIIPWQKDLVLRRHQQKCVHNERFLDLFVDRTTDVFGYTWRHLAVVVETQTRVGVDLEQYRSTVVLQQDIESENLSKRPAPKAIKSSQNAETI